MFSSMFVSNVEQYCILDTYCHSDMLLPHVYALQEDTSCPANVDRVVVVILLNDSLVSSLSSTPSVPSFDALILNYKFLRHFLCVVINNYIRYYNNENEITEINRIKFIGQLLDL